MQPPRTYMPQLPEGWPKCPKFGDPRIFEGLNIIPCKVPLSAKFHQLVGPSGRWTLVDAIRQFRSYGMEVATIIDLTKSRNYYNINEEMEQLDFPPINYVKIACRGRGQSPRPSEVNEAVWHIFTHHANPESKDKYILLHCTHGFNRTGYIVVAALMRLRLGRGMSVRRAVKRFAESRPPGIYKDQYINDLFKYYHEHRNTDTRTPPVPSWKGNQDADDAADAANEDEAAGEEGGEGELPEVVSSHEDIWAIGERVTEQEADWARSQVCGLLGGVGANNGKLRFPGMQPVSLSRDRLRDLEEHRYHVTWKADGTRYLLFIVPHATYIMDRSFNVVRCQMRFMQSHTPLPPAVKQVTRGKQTYPVGKPLTCTLLDGEMVLDVDHTGSQPPRLRYLVYDLCMINETPMVGKPWKERFNNIDLQVIAPRKAERDYIDHWRNLTFDVTRSAYLTPPLAYEYRDERFSVRRKDFWPLFYIEKIFQRFNDPHNIGHESDGLILQGYEDPYVSGTCERLYKWKFAHMNSVDFLLRCATCHGPTGQLELDPNVEEPLKLFLLDQTASRGRGIKYVELKMVDPHGHYQVEFPPNVDPLVYDSKLIECNFDRQRGVWMFMRERRDKDTPNASRVYIRIKDSILDHVDQDLLVGTLKKALQNEPAYMSDRLKMDPAQKAALAKAVETWERVMKERKQQEVAAAGRRPAELYDDDEQPVSPPPVSPPPPGYFDDDFDVRGYDHDEDGDDGGGGAAESYKVSDAEWNFHDTLKRSRDSVAGDGDKAKETAKRRLTAWPCDDEPQPDCPVYEGLGFN